MPIKTSSIEMIKQGKKLEFFDRRWMTCMAVSDVHESDTRDSNEGAWSMSREHVSPITKALDSVSPISTYGRVSSPSHTLDWDVLWRMCSSFSLRNLMQSGQHRTRQHKRKNSRPWHYLIFIKKVDGSTSDAKKDDMI